MSDLEIPKDENRYFSSKEKTCHIKLKDIKTTPSEKFEIDTIGVSGMVKVKQIEQAKPKIYLFGISISQAPAPMVKSKIVTFVPRFMI